MKPNDDARSLPWCFSTLGCPDLELDGAFALARRFGLRWVELRALAGTIDLPGYFAKTFGTPRAWAQHVDAAGIRIASLDTSWRLIDGGADARAAFLNFLPWAEALGGVALRVFDGGKGIDETSLAAVRNAIAWWEQERTMGGWKSTVIIETHDSAFTSAAIGQLMADAPESVGLLWDTHHTWKRGGEDPVATWRAIQRWVRHVHVKDSVSRPSERHPFSYVPMGSGEFPLRGVIDALSEGGFEGPVSLEWERMWHPYLAPLDETLTAAREAGWL